MIDHQTEKQFPEIRTVLLIGIDTPSRIGLKSVLCRLTDADILAADSLEQAGAEELSSDLIVTVPEVLVANSDFFLRRQGRVALLTSGGENANSPFYLIPKTLTEKGFAERLEEILHHLSPAASIKTGLSAREIEVLREIAAGLTSKEIAEKLFISVNTVITHRKNLTAKLGIRSVSGLSLYAMMNGLL